MGTRGPIAQPPQLKVLRGNPGKRKPQVEAPPLLVRVPVRVEPLERAPRCPTRMPAEGRECWQALAPELVRARILTALDVTLFEGLCVAYARARQADAIIEREGTTQTTASGYVAAHPAVAMSRQSWTWVRELAAAFGLSPVSRARVTAEPSTREADADAAFLFGGTASPPTPPTDEAG